jgi:thiol-disulfide isomerase/thioredoxin
MHRRRDLLVLAVLGIVGSFAPVLAQDGPKGDPSKQEKPAASLKVGDPAPALTVTRWLQGDAVTKFQPGKVYVVEFWATWCTACIRSMPHLAELQARYKDRGVTVIGFTSRDIRKSSNSEEKVAAFVKKRGPGLRYSFAYCDDDTTFDAWMKAAGHHNLPGIFVVDRTGRIAYIDGPMFLEMALLKVLAGDSSAKVIGDEMAKVIADYRTLCAPLERDQTAYLQNEPETFLRALKEFEARYPPLADCLPVAGLKLMLLLRQANLDAAKDYAETLLAKSIQKRNAFLLEFLNVLLRERKENKELTALAVRAADALVRIDGGKDAYSLLRLANTYRLSGDSAKAKEYARKAVDASAGESLADRQEIEKEANRLGAGK